MMRTRTLSWAEKGTSAFSAHLTTPDVCVVHACEQLQLKKFSYQRLGIVPEDSW
jgi:hypothetical protein